jgi:predicted ribosome quality control (RQC) complex YloA/Tae2 family protein
MKEINSLEISFLVKKLKEGLIESRIQKIKQIHRDAFLFEVYKPKKRRFLLVSSESLFLTEKSYESRLLTDFCRILRKYLTGETIEDVRQYEFDRIVEIETTNYLLVIELFSKGNLILIDKPERKVISALRMRSWKDRSIKPRKEYGYPPQRINPFKLSPSDFERAFGKKEVVKVLAKDFGFGGEVAERICEKLGIDKKSKKIDCLRLYHFLKKIDREFRELKDVDERLKKEFEKELKVEVEEKKVEEKLERIRKQQEEALKKWQEREKEYRKIGKLLYEKYEEVKKQLDSGSRKVKIDGLTIELDPKKTVQKNAAIYFEKAKKAKKKIEGLRKAMKELEKKKLARKRVKERELKKGKKEWYENFRWFVSSDGFLVIAGKDARTNEKLIRKHMKPSDLVFHTDITGSPFALIKNPERREIPKQTIREAAEFCGSYSKAWKIGISVVDVYYVKPEQVKKEGGLPTGSFMIYGKRNWVRRVPVRVAVGVDDEVIFGPVETVKKKATKYVIITPGDNSVHDLAREIRSRLKTNIKIERIEKIIPYGRGKLER